MYVFCTLFLRCIIISSARRRIKFIHIQNNCMVIFNANVCLEIKLKSKFIGAELQV